MTKARYHLPIPVLCPHCSASFNHRTTEYEPRDEFLNRITTIPWLDSKYGFNVQNIDCSIYNYQTKRIGLFELKTNGRWPSDGENYHLAFLSASLCYCPSFVGVFLIQHKAMGFADDIDHIWVYENGGWKAVMNKQPDGSGFNFSNEQTMRWILSLFQS